MKLFGAWESGESTAILSPQRKATYDRTGQTTLSSGASTCVRRKTISQPVRTQPKLMQTSGHARMNARDLAWREKTNATNSGIGKTRSEPNSSLLTLEDVENVDERHGPPHGLELNGVPDVPDLVRGMRRDDPAASQISGTETRGGRSVDGQTPRPISYASKKERRMLYDNIPVYVDKRETYVTAAVYWGDMTNGTAAVNGKHSSTQQHSSN